MLKIIKVNGSTHKLPYSRNALLAAELFEMAGIRPDDCAYEIDYHLHGDSQGVRVRNGDAVPVEDGMVIYISKASTA